MITILAAAGWLLAQAADPAAVTSPAPAAPVTAAADTTEKPKDPLVCKTEVPLGSRLGGKKTCLPKSVWEQQRRESRDAAENVQRMGRGPFDTSK